MLRVSWFGVLVGSLLYSGGLAAASTVPGATPEAEISSARERAYLEPRAALYRLIKIQASHPSLTPQQRAQLYEQLSHAKFRNKDFVGALRDAQLLEALGRKQSNKGIECMGVLSQAFPYWKLGEIQTAYQRTRRAELCLATAIPPSVRVKVLLSRAQIESEERAHAKALRSVEEAVRVSSASREEELMFMATRMKVILALAVNDIPLALKEVDQLLSYGVHSIYAERLVRAKGLEFAVASAAGLTARADRAMTEKISLMEKHHFNEVLGPALVEYSGFKLKGNRYADAAALSSQALTLEPVLGDEIVANRAHLNHGIAIIHLGLIQAGKDEIESMFRFAGKRAELLAYLPAYIAALTAVGDVDASVQASALLQQIESEDALYHAKEKSEAQGKIDTFTKLSEARAAEALNERKQRNIWLIVAGTSAFGLIGIVGLYGRLRLVNRLLKESNRQLYTSSNRDALTGLFNRRYVENVVSGQSRRANDSSAAIAEKTGLVLLMDVDKFKLVNDTYGHAAGDQVLQATANRLSALFRDDDIFARWGGEEFLALIPNADATEAEAIVQRVLSAISDLPIMLGEIALTVTISVGVCGLPLRLKDRQLTWDELLNLADECLYLAKKNGRNMAYGITNASNVTSLDIAHDFHTNYEEGKFDLFQVFGNRKEAI